MQFDHELMHFHSQSTNIHNITNDQLSLLFNIPLDTLWVISEPIFHRHHNISYNEFD